MEWVRSSVELGFMLFLEKLNKVVVELLPSDLNPQLKVHRLQGEILVCFPIIVLAVGLLFLFRVVQFVKSRLYVRYEKQLAEALAASIEERYQLINKLSAAKKELAEIESSLEKIRAQKDSFNISSLIDNYRKARSTNLKLIEEVILLVKELKEERSKLSRNQKEMMELQNRLEFLKKTLRISKHIKGLFQTCQGSSPPRVEPGPKAAVFPSVHPDLPSCQATFIHFDSICGSLRPKSPKKQCRSSTFTCWTQQSYFKVNSSKSKGSIRLPETH
ncbi:hypothetical protein H1C71_001346 [Ictidomys tridecemlineatus]|nr:hypothetical protein H1C71_001346 [Ictidomys tridecemlineatus]